MGEKRGRPRTTLRALRVRGLAQFDASITQQGIPRNPFREYVAALDYIKAVDALTVNELKNHWTPFAWSHHSLGLFSADTGIPAAAARLITTPAAPFFDGAGQLVIASFETGISSTTQTWRLGLHLSTPAGDPYDPEDFSIYVQVRSYE